jgi:hypothetical protein
MRVRFDAARENKFIARRAIFERPGVPRFGFWTFSHPPGACGARAGSKFEHGHVARPPKTADHVEIHHALPHRRMIAAGGVIGAFVVSFPE